MIRIFRTAVYLLLSLSLCSILPSMALADTETERVSPFCKESLLSARERTPEAYFGDRSPRDAIERENGIIARLAMSAGSIIGANQLVASFVQDERTLAVYYDFLAEIADGTQQPVARLTAEQVRGLRQDPAIAYTNPHFGQAYMSRALRAGDKLYIYKGELIRKRPSNLALHLLPRALHNLIGKHVPEVEIVSIRASEIRAGLVAVYPQYEGVVESLSQVPGSWTVGRYGYQFHGAIRLGNYPLELHLEFQEETISATVRPRPNEDPETLNALNDRMREISMGPNSDLEILMSSGTKESLVLIRAPHIAEFLENVLSSDELNSATEMPSFSAIAPESSGSSGPEIRATRNEVTPSARQAPSVVVPQGLPQGVSSPDLRAVRNNLVPDPSPLDYDGIWDDTPEFPESVPDY